MKRQKKKALAVVVGIAALLLLIAFVVHELWFQADDTEAAAPKELSQESSITLDNTGQSPRMQPKQENLQTSRIEKAAREYDVAGGVGEPPEGWKEDYSHWDSHPGDDLVKVGMMEREEGSGRTYRPTEAALQRLSQIEKELLKAAEDGLFSKEPKGDYIRQEIDEGKIVYVAPNFVERYNALLEEDDAIHEQNTHTVSRTGYFATPSMGTMKFDSGLQITYYRRKSDGSLVRSVDLPSGETKKYVFADSKPDLSGFSEKEIEMMKESWR